MERKYVGDAHLRTPWDPPIEHDLLVSLEDINRGVTKRMKISRRVVSNDGSARKEEKVLTIRCDRQITHFPPFSVDFNFKTGKK